MSTQRSWTVLELLRWTTEHFARRGIETARLDAELLLAHVLGSERLGLYLDFEKPVEPAERARFRELVRRRADEREPVAQLVGSKEFWSLPLRVTRDVLVPRPETETLVSAALELRPDRDAELDLLDLGTGSGAVALALAGELPKARVTAVDCSEPALAVARQNARVLGLGERLRFLAGSWCEPVRGERFDLVVSNPPYLAQADGRARPPELRHEPREALLAGADGLDAHRALAAQVPEVLRAGGRFLVEIDPGQEVAVRGLLGAAGLGELGSFRDLAGRPRVVAARAAEEA